MWAGRDQGVHPELHEFSRKSGEPVKLALGETLLDDEVLALDVPELS
jgi:hypothetical protein